MADLARLLKFFEENPDLLEPGAVIMVQRDASKMYVTPLIKGKQVPVKLTKRAKIDSQGVLEPPVQAGT